MDDTDEATPWKEQERWEAAQMKKTNRLKDAKDDIQKKYEILLEDQIDFIKHEYLAGERVRLNFALKLIIVIFN